MSIIFMITSLIMCMFIIFMKHPLSAGLTLLIQTISMSLLIGFINSNYWYSYILFLIMIGGMLILFTYMTSIASNELFSFSIKLSILMIIMILLIILVYFNVDWFYFLLNNNYETLNYNNNNSQSLNKYINFPNNFILYLLIIYLLITLLATVKITDFKKGPLRQSN